VLASPTRDLASGARRNDNYSILWIGNETITAPQKQTKKTGISVLTLGSTLHIPEHRAIRYRASKELKDQINEPPESPKKPEKRKPKDG